ncbi:MAG TPA: DUF222 domain-containing protein [Mycobacteriales bacterium]|nr:DUF222 domain-containing protein [Mycobacteriales bacterium]
MYSPGPEIEQITAGVTALLARDPHTRSDLELTDSTELLLRLRSQLDAVLVRQLQVIDTRDATVNEFGRATRGWLVEELRCGAEDVNRLLTVARALPYRPVIDQALADARITLDHARLITTAVAKSPAPIRDVVEKELVTAAETVDPAALGRFARELAARLTGDDAEAAAQRRYDSRWVRLSPTFDGMVALDGMLDPAGAATVKAALTPLLGKAGPQDERAGGQRAADALVTVAEIALAAGGLPEHGGEKPQVIVTIGYDQLNAELAAHADTRTDTRTGPRTGPLSGLTGPVTMNGIEVTPATARMIACDAGIIPAVLGSHGEVLDLGRKTKTWSPAQRRALRLEDRGCRWPGCQAPLERCRIHHILFWSRSGRTDKKNGIHICEFHHWLVHHAQWRISKDDNNRIRVWRE